jgi:hypothetical protein
VVRSILAIPAQDQATRRAGNDRSGHARSILN